MVKQIELTQSKVAIVDDADFDELNKHKWYAACIHGKWYAARNISVNGIQRQVLMHQAILPAGDMVHDHKDGDGLNNCRTNLRVCTYADNAHNMNKCRGITSSRFKGVSWCRRMKKWRSQIKVGGRSTWLGSFNLEEEAARAYDDAARRNFGEFARTNF